MYRKFRGTGLFTGSELLGADAVLVVHEDGTIAEILCDEKESAEVADGILCPGMVNAHCHLELSHLKGKIPKHTGLVDFVQQVMKLRVTDGVTSVEMETAMQEMYGEGISAVGDICNTADTVDVKAAGRMAWRNFVEVSGFVGSAAGKRLNEAKAVKARFPEAFIVPHAPYSVSHKLFDLIAFLDEPFTSIHNQESPEEDKLYMHKSGDFLDLYRNFGIDISSFTPTGTSSFSSWLPHFSSRQKIISVHNTFINSSDLELIDETRKQVWFCLCPYANLYIENALPPVDMLRNHNCRIVLGTDSYASNDALSIAREMKLLQEEFPAVPLAEILSWATVNGADALGFAELGRFKQGTKPGVVQLGITKDGLLTGAAKRIL